MKKGILLAISTAMTVFLLATIFFTIQLTAAPELQHVPALSVFNPTGIADTTVDEQAQTESILPTSKVDQATAVTIAKNNGGMAIITNLNPGLVDLNGAVAYEVSFDAGKIYIDSNTGDILGDTIQISPELAGQSAVAFLQTNQYTRVDIVTRNGANVYRVFFIQGIFVYVNFKGQVIDWEYIKPVYSNPRSNPSSNSNFSDEEDD